MLIDKKTLDKIKAFITVKDSCIDWLDRGHRNKDLEYEKEFTEMFHGVKEHYFCNGVYIDIDFKKKDGFRILNETWINSRFEKITLDFDIKSPLCIKQIKHRKYDISFNCNNIRGIIPKELHNTAIKFFEEFFERVEGEAATLKENLDDLMQKEGKKEFCYISDSYYKAKQSAPVIAINLASYATQVYEDLSHLAIAKEIKELRKQLKQDKDFKDGLFDEDNEDNEEKPKSYYKG